MDRLRVLVTSVGSLVATNLLEGLASLGRERFFLIGTNSEAEAANNFACDVVYRVPPTASADDYRAALADIAEREQPDLWVPTRDDDVLELARLAATRPLAGQTLVGSVAAAEVICDKWLSFRFARERGLKVAPTADSVEAGLRLADAHGFPLIGKPRRGYGSRGARFLLDASHLRAALALGDYVVQVPISPAPDWRDHLPNLDAGWPLWYTYVDPGQYASQWLVDPDGSAIEIGATLNVMRSGRNERSMRADDPALAEKAGAYARALAQIGWRGPLNVQCRRSGEGEFFMFELAGRVAGGLGGRERLGIAETQTVLATLFPERFVRPGRSHGNGTVAVKHPQTLAIDGGDLAAFEKDGVWRRSF